MGCNSCNYRRVCYHIFIFLNVKGSVLIGIVSILLLGIPFSVTAVDGVWNTFSDFGLRFVTQCKDFLDVGLFGFADGLRELFEGKDFLGALLSVLLIVISIMDMFDTIGTLLGTAKRANLLDKDGNMPGMKKALLCDAIATTAGSMMGTATVTNLCGVLRRYWC